MHAKDPSSNSTVKSVESIDTENIKSLINGTVAMDLKLATVQDDTPPIDPILHEDDQDGQAPEKKKKKRTKKKKSAVSQTTPPTIPISTFFPDGQYPIGEEQEYQNE